MKRDFASDNNAGIHPEVLARIAAVNVGHVRAYGADAETRAAEDALRAEFGADAAVFFVFGGTGANVLGLKALTEPHHAILCAASSHIHGDECGAPERFTGSKLIAIDVARSQGKLTVDSLRPWLRSLGQSNHSQPHVVSITQATELGTVYRPEEISALSTFCKEHGLFLHLDGARLANAAASLNASLGAITTELGVDVLTFGGTKNGLLGGEAVIFRDAKLARAFPWIRKQGMQLPSKMRFVAAQFSALLQDELWRQSAAHANAQARFLGERLQALHIEIAYPVEANGVFPWLPAERVPELQKLAHFYVWDDEPRADGNVLCRLMASFDTTEDDVKTFVAGARRVLEG